MRSKRTFAAILGEVIAERRHQKGLSQEALAFRCGRHWTFLSELERGLKSPTVRTLVAIATALETAPSELLREAERRARDRGVEIGQGEE